MENINTGHLVVSDVKAAISFCERYKIILRCVRNVHMLARDVDVAKRRC